MHIRLYTFSKKSKSTGIPAESMTYDRRSFVCKKPTTDAMPVLLLTNPNNAVFNYNYAYIEEWAFYYRIVHVTYNTDETVEVSLKVDPLATARTYIMLMSAFVAYSSSDYSALLTDPRVPKLNAVNVLNSSPYNTIFGSNHYDYLWVAGESGTNCYRCNVQNVTAAIFQASNDDLIENLCQTWADIQSCILYCRSFSLDSQSSGSSEEIYIGKYGTGVNGAKLNDGNLIEKRENISIAIPHTYTDFRRFAFSVMKVTLPFVGVVELAISDFVENPASNANVNIDYVLNLASGVVTYKISNDDGAVIGTFSGVAGRAKPVSLYSPYSGAGVLTSAGTSIGGAVAVGLATGPVGIAAGIGAAIAGIAGMVTASETTSGSFIGSNDGSAEEEINSSIIVTVIEYDSRIEPSNLTDVAGRPCNKVRSLTGLTGYCQTQGFQLVAPFDETIIDEVNELMDSGVYLE